MSSVPRVLVVEDEHDIAALVKHTLERGGEAQVELVASGDVAIRVATEDPPDLVILDLNLPVLSGSEVCRILRARPETASVPIIMLTARTAEADRVAGLDMGADDYVTKPFSPRELRARVRALLRRAAPEADPIQRFGDCEIDFARAELRRAGTPVDVTALELKMLQTFLHHQGRVLTRAQVVDDVWGHDVFVTDRVVDTHVVKLRRKIEADPAAPKHIVSVRGIGYRFES